MKVYTFNAPDDSRVEILSSLRPANKDRIFNKFIREASYTEVDSIQNCHLAIYPHKVFHPETLEFDRGVFDAAIAAERYQKPIIIDATSDSDTFLDIPTAHILRYGLYKSQKKAFETECPFWSNYRTKNGLNFLKIDSTKGKKPAVGFCGTTSSAGKLSNLVKFSIPTSLAQSALCKGKITRHIDIRVKEGISLKLREKAIALLAGDLRLDTYFDITNQYKTYYCQDKQNRLLLEKLFIENTSKCDYVLCIRGTGNYSGRLYMALSAGRIPVVLDTDVVIPYEERLHIVKIPIHSLHKISDIILEHFENVTDTELKHMKLQNREIYNQLLAPEKFLKHFVSNIVD